MSSGKGFAVDVPVTDLDQDLDDFNLQDEEPEHDFNRQLDIADMNLDASNPNTNIFIKSINAFKSLFAQNGFSKLKNTDDSSFVPNDDIELATTSFGNNGGYDENNDDLDFDYYKNPSVTSRILRFIYAVITSKLLIYPLLLTGGCILLIFIVVASKNGSSSQGPFEPMGEPEFKDDPDHRMKPETNLLTVVLAIEGLHPHFISDANMPFLANLINSTDTLFAPYINNVNPVSKVPNLWTISTGKYPAHNGIIGDEFYDKDLGNTFTNTDMDSQWWLSEPIWETVTKNNKHATAFNWPMVRISEVNPVDNDDGFHVKFEYREQLIKVNKYLSGSDAIANEINLLLSSVNTLASKIRKYGLGPELTTSLNDLDNFIAEFYDLIAKLHIDDVTNVIITSDGNMAPVTKERVISLESIVDISKAEHIEGKPIVGLYPNDDVSTEALFEEIREKWAEHPFKQYFHVYKGEEVSEQIYGGRSSRIAPILIVPSSGYLVQSESSSLASDPIYVSGYANNEMLSRGVFIATGPYFEQNSKSEKVLKPFENIQIYNMLCQSLNIEPNKNDGDVDFLKNPDNYIQGDWNDNLKYPGVEYQFPIIKDKSVIEYRFTPPEPVSLKPISLIPGETSAEEVEDTKSEQTSDSTENEHLEEQESQESSNSSSEDQDDSSDVEDKPTDNDEDDKGTSVESKIEQWWDSLKQTVEDIFDKHDDQRSQAEIFSISCILNAFALLCQ